MPPSGRTRYPHAFSKSPVSPGSEGSRGRRKESAPALSGSGGSAPLCARTLAAHGLAATARCCDCGHRTELDLMRLIGSGKGDAALGTLKLRCTACGSKACIVSVAPPRAGR